MGTKGKAVSRPTAGSRGPGANATTKTTSKKVSTSASASSSSSKKRKSDAVEDQGDLPEIDDDDPRLYTTDSCNQIRRKIRNTIESGAMKVGEFQKVIGCSSPSYQRFMKQNGPDAGLGSDVYIAAARFFRKRELQGLKAVPPAPKKARKSGGGDDKGGKGGKSSSSSSLDVSGVQLSGEETQSVAVLETCDEMRKKIRAFLRRGDVTQAALCREIAKSFPQERKVQSKQLNDFLGKSGPLAGNTSCVYYGSYVFFEKLRLKEGKPKSQMRLDTEWEHPSGINTTDVMNWFLCKSDHRPVLDKFGKVYSVPAGGRL